MTTSSSFQSRGATPRVEMDPAAAPRRPAPPILRPESGHRTAGFHGGRAYADRVTPDPAVLSRLRLERDRTVARIQQLEATVGAIVESGNLDPPDDEHDPEG